MSITFPAEFTSATASVPANKRPVAALVPSREQAIRYELITARYDPEHAKAPWRFLSGQPVNKDGRNVLAWRKAPELAG